MPSSAGEERVQEQVRSLQEQVTALQEQVKVLSSALDMHEATHVT